MKRVLANVAAAIAASGMIVSAIALARHARSVAPADETAPGLFVDAPETMRALERAGYGFDRVVGPALRRQLHDVVAKDIDELKAGHGKKGEIKRPFQAAWISRGHFELVAVVNRLDRLLVRETPETTCGETRLVYRLAIDNPHRPRTRLPFTLNVRMPHARLGLGNDCAAVARRWHDEKNITALLDDLGAPDKLEIDFQSFHVPSFKNDMDDNAEYLLRSFHLGEGGKRLVPEPLIDTPRSELSAEDRAELARSIRDSARAIDEGTYRVPTKFLALRATSVSPRGHLDPRNRPFSTMWNDEERLAIARDMQLERFSTMTTPELMFRRLDERSCPGCHQSHGVAGFHVLGEERERTQTFNALAVGHSPHVTADLRWRANASAAIVRGDMMPKRPTALRDDGPGGMGAFCNLVDAGEGRAFPRWTCAEGLACRDMNGGLLGTCAPITATKPGDPCERVTVTPSPRLAGAIVRSATVDSTCPLPKADFRGGAFCAPNWLGFTGGMCSTQCDRVGVIEGNAVCAPLPSAGYEAECFVKREPVEKCLERYLLEARVATCDREHTCRDDYACARVPNAPEGRGACLPPYFVFQLRVDGPLLDR